jgi:hypothetical protein
MTEKAYSWPPTYDKNLLKDTIRQIKTAEDFYSSFYAPSLNYNLLCQGDILKFESSAPMIDQEGYIIAFDKYDYWQILSNTCDLYRDISDVNTMCIVPLTSIGKLRDKSSEERNKYRSYENFRQFYLPAWPISFDEDEYLADFTMPVTIEKAKF